MAYELERARRAANVARRLKQEITIQVIDTGIGIHQDDLPKIFEEFSQLGRLLSQRSGGSRLGLTISKKFVELHGGRIRVESKQNVGATITFSLPLREELGVIRTVPEWETWVRMPPDKDNRRSM